MRPVHEALAQLRRYAGTRYDGTPAGRARRARHPAPPLRESHRGVTAQHFAGVGKMNGPSYEVWGSFISKRRPWTTERSLIQLPMASTVSSERPARFAPAGSSPQFDRWKNEMTEASRHVLMAFGIDPNQLSSPTIPCGTAGASTGSAAKRPVGGPSDYELISRS